MLDLKKSELFLLEWLGLEDYSQYGECKSAALDKLVTEGLAQVHEDRGLQAGFIAQGDSEDYRAVSLTDAGRKALHELHNNEGGPDGR